MPVKKASNRILANSALIYLSSALKYYPCESLQSEIDDLRSLNENRNYIVAVVGDFKRGKSSLINALLGAPVLPMGIEPMTATLNRITYGSIPKVSIEHKDNTVTEININELANYVTKSGIQIARTINEAVIEYPTVLCQNGIDILDTPGLNDDEEMTAVAKTALNQVHAAVIAVSAKLLFSKSESEWAADLIALDKLEYLIFAVTYIDCIPKRQRQRLLDYLRQRIYEAVMTAMQIKYSDRIDLFEKAERLLNPNSLVLIPVSPVDALEAFDNGDNELLQESNLPEFKKQLMALLTAQQEEYMLYRTKELISSVSYWISQNKDKMSSKDEANSVKIQNCKTALSLLSAYPGFVQSEIRNMNAALQYQVNIMADICDVLVNNMQNFFADKNQFGYTPDQIHSLMDYATQETKNIAYAFYESEFANKIFPILNQTLIRIVEQRTELYSYCRKVFEVVPVLIPPEEKAAFFSLNAADYLPVIPPEWTLDTREDVSIISKSIGNGNIINIVGQNINIIEEQAKKTKEKLDGILKKTKLKEMVFKAEELTGRSMLSKAMSTLTPKLTEISFLLKQQWLGVPYHLTDLMNKLFVEQENLENNRTLENELYRKIGEFAAISSANQKNDDDYQEALKYIRMAEKVF